MREHLRARRLLWLALVPVTSLLALACSKSNDSDDGGGERADAAALIDAGPVVDAAPRIDSAGQPDYPDGGTPCPSGLGAWTGNDNFPFSQSPPCGFTPAQVPMFVAIGWDDNGDAEGMKWAVQAHESRNSQATFFLTTSYGQDPAVLQAWKDARAKGFEIGNHTVHHEDGGMWTEAQWMAEIGGADPLLQTIAPGEIYGFRTPFLSYNDNTFTVVDKLGLRYESTIEEGYEDGHDGSNYFWPYTLDERSPGHTQLVSWGLKTEINKHPGLWLMPTYAVIAPPDDQCVEYGVPVGLRSRLKARVGWFDEAGGKITGFDYNLWARRDDGGFETTPAEFLAILKYSFDRHNQGNKAPFLLGAHSAYYVDAWSSNAPGAPSATDRRHAIEDFLDYAQSKGGRVTSFKAVLDFVRNPTAN